MLRGRLLRECAYRVHGAAHDSAQRIPGHRVKPVPHLVEAILREVLGHAVVEVRVELVDDALVLDDREQADGEGQDADGQQGHPLHDAAVR